MQPITLPHSEAQILATNKVLRNTYALLAMTLLFSAAAAGVSMMLELPRMVSWVGLIGAMVLIMFVLPKTANKASGIWVVFGLTGLLGLSLGPTLNYYLQTGNGGQIVSTALGGTGIIFLAMSGYALTSKKDFTFMAGFLMVGLVGAIVAMIANLFLQIPALQLAISAVVVLIMSGFILYDTSAIVRGEQKNYILATVSIYLSLYNIFVHLLSLLGIFGDE